MTMAVRNWRVDERPDAIRVSADVGDTNLWFTLPPGTRAPEAADSFCAMALIPAMALGEDLDLSALPPLTAGYVERLEAVQEIWACWNPFLRHVEIRSSAGDAPPVAAAGTVAFFSGGIDAVFTALARRPVLDRLVLINGFDFSMSPDEFTAALTRTSRLADALGLPLATIETNWIQFTRHHGIARNTTFGSCLAALGLALASERVIIGSSNSYARLTPMGSHPILDPLWSNGATSVEHHGSHATRNEKLMTIADHPELLRELWVCHVNPVANCGTCPKCLRFRLALALLGKERLAFPGVTDDPAVAWCGVIRYRSERAFLPEMIALARARGRDDVARRLIRAERGVRMRGFLRDVDTLFLGGALHRRTATAEASDLYPWGRGPLPES
ncbi:MAG TPA: hypothetical protein VGM77_06925 [Gemmatimonadales bacterium]|jgi:hypothetical protein